MCYRVEFRPSIRHIQSTPTRIYSGRWQENAKAPRMRRHTHWPWEFAPPPRRSRPPRGRARRDGWRRGSSWARARGGYHAGSSRGGRCCCLLAAPSWSRNRRRLGAARLEWPRARRPRRLPPWTRRVSSSTGNGLDGARLYVIQYRSDWASGPPPFSHPGPNRYLAQSPSEWMDKKGKWCERRRRPKRH